MVYASKRNARYTGYFEDDTGKRRSAGTYATREEALVRAMDAQTTTPGSLTGVAATRYRDYVATWLQTETKILIGTKRGYESNFRVHILPVIGDMQVGAITLHTVNDLLDRMQYGGASPFVAAQCKAAIGSSFKPLVPAVIPVNPTHGVKVYLPPPTDFDLVEVVDYQRIEDALPNEGCRLFALFLVSSGARFGEASEIRVKDLNFRTGKVAFLRRVSQVGGKRNHGSRFAVLAGTKPGREYGRSIRLPLSVMSYLKDWITKNALGPNDLLFSKSLLRPKVVEEFDETVAGEEFIGKDRRTHVHGTGYAYTAGGCRCPECRLAIRLYRRTLRKKTGGRPSPCNTTDHMANDIWRKVWRKAIEDAGLDWYPRTHDLRHAFATHLVGKGVSLYEVMELLGHRDIKTTMKYQHQVEAQRSKAVEHAADFANREEQHG